MSMMNGQNLINDAMIEYWGAKCEDFDADCQTCQAWAELDATRDGLRALLNVSASDSKAIANLQAKYSAFPTQDQSDKGGMR